MPEHHDENVSALMSEDYVTRIERALNDVPGIDHAALAEHAPVLDFRGVLRSPALQAAASC